MPLVRFTDNLQRHVACHNQQVEGRTVRQALDSIFLGNQRLRGYLLDDQGGLRKHMMIFVDGRMVCDRAGLSDAVESATHLDVMQALSGG